MSYKRLKVAGRSDVNSLAGSIMSCLEAGDIPETVTIGAFPVNQALKAYIIARGIAFTKGMNLTLEPRFEKLSTDKGEVTAIVMRIECK